MDFSIDDFLGGKIKLKQLKNGYRATSDAVMLSACVDEMKSGATVLDVGAGTGAVSLCLAARFKDVIIKGIELQEENVLIANENSEINNFSKNVKFFQGNVFEKNIFSKESFDFVISNPPFMDKNDYPSPNEARDKTRREADLEGWVDFCVKRVCDYGKIFLIIKPEKINEVLQIFSKKIGAIKIYPIHSKKNSVAKKIIICGTKSSRKNLEIMPSITLHDEGGKPNSVCEKIQKDGKSFSEIL